MIVRVPRREIIKKVKTRVCKKSKNALVNDLMKLGFFTFDTPDTFLKIRKCMPTGLPILDIQSARDENGVYGLPFGRQIEFSGKADAGKTSMMLYLAGVAQKLGYTVVWIETETTLLKLRAKSFVNIDEFLIQTPDYLEECLALIKKAVLTVPKYTDDDYDPNKGLVVFWDSVAATQTKAEFMPKKEVAGTVKEFEAGAMAAFARTMSIYQRKIKARIAKRNVLIVYNNQLKDKIGVSFGAKTQTYGGNALRFHCALRWSLTHKGRVKKGADAVGMEILMKNMKNKCLMPWGEVDSLTYKFDVGIDQSTALLMALQKKNLITKTGANYIIPGLSSTEPYTAITFRNLLEREPWVFTQLTEVINVIS